MEYKIILSSIAVVLTFASFIPYVLQTLKGKTKPHIFSWLVWSVLVWIGLAAQLSDGAGVGAWTMWFTAALTTGVFFLSLFLGEKSITVTDWVSLAGAAVALFLWVLAKQPFFALILVILVDFFGYIPTVRKSYVRPYEEEWSLYAISAVKWFLTFFALENYSVFTWLYPVFIFLANTLFVCMLLIRRKQQKITS